MVLRTADHGGTIKIYKWVFFRMCIEVGFPLAYHMIGATKEMTARFECINVKNFSKLTKRT